MNEECLNHFIFTFTARWSRLCGAWPLHTCARPTPARPCCRARVDATLVPAEHPDRKTMTSVKSLSRYGTLKRLYRVETRDGAERVSPRPYTDEYKVRGVDNAEVKAFHHGDVFDGVW